MAERNTRIRASQLANIRPSDVTASATNAVSDGYVPSKAVGSDEWTWISPGGSCSALIKSVNQASHGFVVGDVLRWEGGSGGADYAKAKADTIANAEVIGIVSAVADSNNFTLLSAGYIDLGSGAGLTAGDVYFLSDSTAGALTATEPTTEDHISKPLLIAISATEGYFFNWRGLELTDATNYTTAFTNSDLSSGVLTVTHNFGHQYVQVQVFDENDEKVDPDAIDCSAINSLTIDLTTFGTISGTWHVVVLDAGATTNVIPSKIQDADQDTSWEALEDYLKAEVANTEIARIDATGLGIGATTIDELLHIEDSGANSTPALKLENDTIAWKLMLDGSDSDILKLVETTDANASALEIAQGSQIVTFTQFPVTPSSAPTSDYQVANKKYVDDNASGGMWELIEKQTPSASSTITFNTGLGARGLWKIKLTGATVGTSNLMTMVFNNNTTNNYAWWSDGNLGNWSDGADTDMNCSPSGVGDQIPQAPMEWTCYIYNRAGDADMTARWHGQSASGAVYYWHGSGTFDVASQDLTEIDINFTGSGSSFTGTAVIYKWTEE